MYVDINPIPRFPVFTPKQAVAYAKSQVDHPDKDYTGMCLHFTAWSYGFQSSGVSSATSFWAGTPSTQKVRGDAAPPAGAIALWTGGSHGFGHATIAVGRNGAGQPMIASNDIRRTGRIDIVPLAEITARWGLKYEGWAKPYYAFGIPDDRRAPDVYDSDLQWGSIYQAKLRSGVTKSDSVKRLQTRLGIKVTGNYNAVTKAAAFKWLDNHGFAGDGSDWSMPALNALFGGNYFVRPATR